MRTTGPEMRVQSKGTWLPAGGDYVPYLACMSAISHVYFPRLM